MLEIQQKLCPQAAKANSLGSTISVGSLETLVENAEVGAKAEGEDDGEGTEGESDGKRVAIVA